jgi:hypothetical protein
MDINVPLVPATPVAHLFTLNGHIHYLASNFHFFALVCFDLVSVATAVFHLPYVSPLTRVSLCPSPFSLRKFAPCSVFPLPSLPSPNPALYWILTAMESIYET